MEVLVFFFVHIATMLPKCSKSSSCDCFYQHVQMGRAAKDTDRFAFAGSHDLPPTLARVLGFHGDLFV